MTRKAGFVVDLGRCTGCGACVLACRLEHGWPSTAPRRRVLPLNDARRSSGPTYFLSLACHHCERPACLRACPSAAYERDANGIVRHREDRCLGCRYCEMACPFGAPRYDMGRRIVTKCDFCAGRFDRGERPACVAACPTEALRLLGDGSSGGGPANVPGFEDRADCRPSIRFTKARGIRGQRFDALLARLAGRQ